MVLPNREDQTALEISRDVRFRVRLRDSVLYGRSRSVMASWTSARSLEDLGISRSAVAAGVALFVTGFLLRGFLNKRLRREVVASPLNHVLDNLSEAELAGLPYPLDSLPGARDVQSPAGSIRVYEFGPENGRKVLLLHGISTPCLALGGVAHGLADKG